MMRRLTHQYLNHALGIEQMHKSVFCGKDTRHHVAAGAGWGRLLNSLERNLDHVKHLIHEKTVPVITERHHQMGTGAGRPPSYAQNFHRIYHGHDPTPQMGKSEHAAGREWHLSQATIAKYFDHHRRIDREAGITHPERTPTMDNGG